MQRYIANHYYAIHSTKVMQGTIWKWSETG